MMRKACIEPIRFNADGTIDEVEMTSQGAAPPLDAHSQTDGARACLMKGNTRIQLMEGSQNHEELAGIRDGDMACWRYLDFGRSSRRITLRLHAPLGGMVYVHADEPDGLLLGTVSVSAATDWQEVTSRIRKTRGVHALWLKFTAPVGNTSKETDLFRLDWFRFS